MPCVNLAVGEAVPGPATYIFLHIIADIFLAKYIRKNSAPSEHTICPQSVGLFRRILMLDLPMLIIYFAIVPKSLIPLASADALSRLVQLVCRKWARADDPPPFRYNRLDDLLDVAANISAPGGVRNWRH